MSVEQNSDESGEVFGTYRVFERIGVGGMATVHRAKEIGIEGFERWVALKRLLPHLAEDASFVRSFVREAKLAALLAHPSIVQIYELGRVGHEYFISMELIDGHDVRQILRHARRVTGPPPIAVTVGILSQICDALEYAHSRLDDNGNPVGLVHRDVSPSNVIVGTSGHLKIIDFGIAKAQLQHLQTHTGRVKGKMAYMSPEAIRGQAIDGRSDLFSLGVLAHELLTARPLFATKNDYTTLQRVQNAAIAPPSTYNRECPPELDAIVLRALERDCDDRWQTAGEILNELIELRKQYDLSTQRREIAAWTKHAFSQDEPAPGRRRNATPTAQVAYRPATAIAALKAADFAPDGSHGEPLTGPTGPAQVPVGNVALPIAEEDDGILEIAWGGRSAVFDEQHVPADENSEPADDATAAALAPMAGEGAPADGVVDAQVLSMSSRSLLEDILEPGEQKNATLIAPAPPPPSSSRAASSSAAVRRSWATGTLPPKRNNEDLQLDRFPLGEHSDDNNADDDDRHITSVVEVPVTMRRPATSTGSVPQVRFRKRVPTNATGVSALPELLPEAPQDQNPVRIDLPEATPPEPIPAYRSGGTSAIGAGIVEQRQRSSSHLVLGIVLVVAMIAGAIYIVPRLGGADSDAAPHKADALTPAAAAHAAVPSTNRSAAAGPASASAIPSASAEGSAPSESDSAVRLGLSEASKLTAKAGTVLAPANAMHRRAGSDPKLPGRHRAHRGRMAAAMCVDTRGMVTHARVVSQVPERVKRRVEKTLRTWRYQPHQKHGVAVDACFAVTVRVR